MQLVMFVQLPVQKRNSMTNRVVASLPRGGGENFQRIVEQSFRPVGRVIHVGGERFDPEFVQKRGEMQARFQLREKRCFHVGGDLGANRGANVFQPSAQHGHGPGGGSEAMRHNLHTVRAGDGPHRLHGGGVIPSGDVVPGEKGVGRRQLDAGAIVQQPDVIPVGKEKFQQVGFDGVDGEDPTLHSQPV